MYKEGDILGYTNIKEEVTIVTLMEEQPEHFKISYFTHINDIKKGFFWKEYLEGGYDIHKLGHISEMHDSTFWHQKALEAIQKQKELTGERDKSDVNQDVTKLLDLELQKPGPEINLEKIEQYIKSGADLDFRDNFGYSFGERAGMRLRYDVVARINELRGGLK